MKSWICVGVAVLSLCLASPAMADSFMDCDGFGPPSPRGDGVTAVAKGSLFGSQGGGGDMGLTRPRLGLDGVEACSRALSDPRLLAKHDLQRVNLLKARALHKVLANDNPGALQDLAAAQAAASRPTDPYFVRSLGFDMELIRVLALRESGDAAGARELAAGLWKTRGWSRTAVAASDIALGEAGDPKLRLEMAIRAAQLSPRSIDRVFMQAFWEGRWADAIAVYPLLVAPYDPSIDFRYDGDRVRMGAINDSTAAEFNADRAMRQAYALAALGRGDKGLALIDAAGKRFDEATLPRLGDPALDYRSKALFSEVRKDIIQFLPIFRDLVEARRDVSKGRPELAVGLLHRGRVIPGAIGADLLSAARPLLTPEKTGAIRLVDGALKDKELQPGPLPARDRLDLFDMLPEPETLERAMDPGSAGTPESGQSRSDGRYFVEIKAPRASAAAVEEMTMLKAAEITRAAGKPAFLVLERSDLRRVYVAGSARASSAGQHGGHETWMFILPVDLADMPAAYLTSAWRAIDAQAVIADLGPLYRKKAR